VLPLDDDFVDLLIERNPKFREQCQAIRERRESGQYLTHEDVREYLAEE
jgi:hypothetical protein